MQNLNLAQLLQSMIRFQRKETLMKKTFLILTMLIICASSLFTQTPPPVNYTLTLQLSENNAGVYVSPPDVWVYEDSVFTFNAGTVVKLQAGMSYHPDPNNPGCGYDIAINSWSGDVTGGFMQRDVTVEMSVDKTVSANFGFIPYPCQPPSPPPTTAVIQIVPNYYSVDTRTPFTMNVNISSPISIYAAYTIQIAYDPVMLSVDKTLGSDGVSVGQEGFVSAVNVQEDTIIISGFDTTGKGPGINLPLLQLHLRSGDTTGNTNLVLRIENLFSPGYLSIKYYDESVTTVIIKDLRGDVNGDQLVNIIDALMIAQYSVGINPPGFTLSAADVSCDGIVNIVDALMVAQYQVGIRSDLLCN